MSADTPDASDGGVDDPLPASYALRFTEQADRDILLTFDWVEERAREENYSDADALGRAERWLAGLNAALAALSTFPRQHARAPEAALSDRDVRRMHYRNSPNSVGHHVFYDVTDEGEDGPTVLVLHVRPANRPLRRAEATRLLRKPSAG